MKFQINYHGDHDEGYMFYTNGADSESEALEKIKKLKENEDFLNFEVWEMHPRDDLLEK